MTRITHLRYVGKDMIASPIHTISFDRNLNDVVEMATATRIDCELLKSRKLPSYVRAVVFPLILRECHTRKPEVHLGSSVDS